MITALPSPGLHYIGQLHQNSLLRIAFDQISEGQLEFQKLQQHFDTIQIGLGKQQREYTIHSGKVEMEEHLLKQFPEDTAAIHKFFQIMKVPLTAQVMKYHVCVMHVSHGNRSQLRRPTTWQR